ncbi:MAG: hypothetical protein ABSG33_02740 [Candidatus Bathyarchaeia archaeon]|jgi:hypothetical protein
MSLRVQIDPKLERRFRETALKKFGCGKGALSKAAEEAILNWVTCQKETPTFEGDPIKGIEGLLKDVDIDSVTLQHLSNQLWDKNNLSTARKEPKMIE